MKAQKAIEENKIGQIQTIRITSRDPTPNNLSEKINSVETVYQSVIHDIDMARWLTNEEPERVYAVQPTSRNFGAVLNYKSGIIVTIDYAKTYGYDQRVEIHGEKGVAIVDNPKTSSFKLLSQDGITGDPTFNFFDERYVEAYKRELNHFVNVLDQKEKIKISGKEVIQDSKVADMIIESINNKKELEESIDFKFEDFSFPKIEKVKELNVCLVGAGRMGKIRAEAITRNPKSNLLYIVDTYQPARDEIASRYGCKSVEDIKIALNDSRVNAVWISVSTSFHFDIIKLAAEHKKAIYVEKPVALSTEETHKSFKVCHENGVPLLVGWNRRFDPSIKKLYKIVQQGDLGKNLILRMSFGDHPLPPIEVMKNLGNIFHDLMVHNLDICLHISKSTPKHIYATGNSWIKEMKENNVLDTGVIMMTFPNGEISIQTESRSCTFGYDQRFEVVGTKQLAIVENYSKTSLYLENEKNHIRDLIHHSFDDRYFDAHYNEVEHFVNVMTQGEEPVTNYKENILISIISQLCQTSFEKSLGIHLK